MLYGNPKFSTWGEADTLIHLRLGETACVRSGAGVYAMAQFMDSIPSF